MKQALPCSTAAQSFCLHVNENGAITIAAPITQWTHPPPSSSSSGRSDGWNTATVGCDPASDISGLGEAREAELLRRLREEADGLAGELVFGHICEAAQVLLSERAAFGWFHCASITKQQKPAGGRPIAGDATTHAAAVVGL